MKYADASARLAQLEAELKTLRQEMIKVRRAAEPQEMKAYEFTRPTGETASWADLFATWDDLIVIHNMGKSCSYCTLWADGFNGVYEHLASRAAFVVVTPDAPKVQAEFAASRSWRFPMISYKGTTFGEDSGYRRDGRWHPGVSVLKRRGKEVVRVSDSPLGPGDLFCSVWHLLDMIPEGPNGWQPKFTYA